MDHGVTFHVRAQAARTVLWGWEGRALTDGDAERVDALRIALDRTLADELADLLTAREIRRSARVSGSCVGRAATPGGGGPAIPWPPL